MTLCYSIDDPELSNVITFDIESLLSNENLENILLDIENELEMNACDKSDGIKFLR